MSKKTTLIKEAINTPWKFWNEVWRIILLPVVRIQFWLAGIKWGKGWKIYGLPILQIYKGSKVEMGDYLQLRSSVKSNPLAPFHPVVISTRSDKAIIKIGDHFGMTGGSLVAAKKIEIGNHVLIGANSSIMDTDFHPLEPQKRRLDINAGRTESVKIGNDVFVGTQAIILKGVEIKSGTIVGAGEVVR